MTDQELIKYYVNLLILQYQGKPNASATIGALSESSMIFELSQSVRSGYDVNTAIGNQLDLLGEYIGIDRIITGLVFSRKYFGYVEYGADVYSLDEFAGYTEYGDEPTDDAFFRYKDSEQSIYTLTDEEYRVILKLKIIQNSINHSATEIDDLITQIFGSTVIFSDRRNMSISYIFDESQEFLVTIANSEGLLPRPMAVGISVSFTEDIENIFSYGSYGSSAPDFAVGYSEYSVTPIGGMAKYG